MDYSALLFDPVWDALGVPATFNGAAISVFDNTRAKLQASNGVEVRSVGPSADVRIPELTAQGIAREDYKGATLAFNGRTWTVRSYELQGSPNGEDLGLVRFLLMAAPVPDNGGGVPAWVPAGAKIHIDLIGGTPQGRAWVDGTGEVAVDTLLGADPNTENGWAASEYDPANLTADGYITPDPPVAIAKTLALIGDARARVIDEATIVIRFKQVTDDPSFASFVIMSADGADAIEMDLGPAPNCSMTSWGGSLNNGQSDVVNASLGDINCVAVTLTAARADFAVNGGAAIAGSLVDADRPAGNPLVAVIVAPGLAGGSNIAWNTIQSIAIYDALADTTGLSELSAP